MGRAGKVMVRVEVTNVNPCILKTVLTSFLANNLMLALTDFSPPLLIYYNQINYVCQTFSCCVFSYVFSNDLLAQMQNHTGYICLTFPQCGFSYVSSYDLLAQMHNRKGCICLTFPRCVFSNVSSKFGQIRSVFFKCVLRVLCGCIFFRAQFVFGICLTFHRCVVLNVSSKRLHMKIYSNTDHTDCICMTFFRCMSAESSNCLYESIVALFALVWLFCCCVFSNMS